MRTSKRLALVFAFAALLCVPSGSASNATDTDSNAPAAQAVAKYLLHVDGMT